MSFPQLGYPQYLSAGQAAVYGGDRPGVLAAAVAAAAAAGSGRAAGAELGGSSTAAVTSVLGMYASPYSAPNYSAFLPYTTDLSLFSQMGSQYELKDNPGVHPATFAAHTAPGYYPYGQFQYGDPGRPKNATRESTSTLKAWLNEHRKNPYPTKGEKIMLAIITKMTLTQVSTWFANARRRLKKENKMTWAPRNKSEDEDDDDGDGERGKEEHSDKLQDNNETSAEDEGISLHVDSLTDHSCSAESDGEKIPCRAGDHLCESGTESKDKYEDEDEDEDDLDEEDRPLSAKAVTSSPLTGIEAPVLSHQHEGSPRTSNKATLDNRISPSSQTQASKPKLWSLAEIATSDVKHQNIGQSCQPSSVSSATSSASHNSTYPSSSILGRHIYYTSPFYSNYTNYGNFNALQSQGILRYNSATLASNEGLSQTVLNSNSLHKHSTSDSIKTATSPLDQHYRSSSYESKKDPTEVCTVGVQPYL